LFKNTHTGILSIIKYGHELKRIKARLLATILSIGRRRVSCCICPIITIMTIITSIARVVPVTQGLGVGRLVIVLPLSSARGRDVVLDGVTLVIEAQVV